MKIIFFLVLIINIFNFNNANLINLNNNLNNYERILNNNNNNNNIENYNDYGNNNNKNNINIKLLKNGGIQLGNKPICPFSYSGEDCSLANTTEICNHAKDQHYGEVGSICCWSKYRTLLGLTELKMSTGENENKNLDEKLSGIFETYGPYFERDVQLINALLERDENNQLRMKYSNFFERNPNNNQIQVDGDQSLGFVLLIHNIDMDAIKNIFRIIYQPYHYYVIHIDKNFSNLNKMENLNEFFKELYNNGRLSNKKYENYPNNIKISDKRFHGEWGTISLVYMELASYTFLFDMVEERSKATNSPSLFSHMINLSANDMMTRSLKNISKILFQNENINTSYIHCCMADQTVRYESIFYEDHKGTGISKNVINQYDCGIDRVITNKPVLDGSQWHFLTSRFIHFLISSPKSLEKLFSLKYVLIPDESFFQSIHPIFGGPVNPRTHRITLWANYGYSVTLQDLDKLEEDAYFIRKVYTNEVREEMIKKFKLIE